MANITITNNDIGGVILKDAVHEDAILQFPGADTYAEGTILARKEVSDTVSVAADGGNTGNGTVTASVAVGDAIPLVGDYVLTCTAAATNGGTFKLEDPNGNLVAEGLEMIAGAGASTEFVAGGLSFTITDGGTDFAAADFFTLTVAADGDMVIYDVDGTGGAQFPRAVLTYEVTTTGAADVAARVMVSGQVRRGDLVIDGGGTVTDAIVDKLRDYGIIALAVDELNIQDNQ